MSFSWMKPTTVFLSRALIVALTVTVAFTSNAPEFIGNAKAEPISENDRDARKTRRSYAAEYSEVKEEIISKKETLESKKTELEEAETKLKSLKKADSWDSDDALLSHYGGSSCECSPKNQCTMEGLIGIGAVTADDFTTLSYSKGGGKNCVEKAGTTQPNPDVSGRAGVKGPDVTGQGGPTDAKNCITVSELKPGVDRGGVCLAVYEYSLTHSPSGSLINRLCVAKAKQCGLVKLEIDRKGLPEEIALLKKEIKTLTAEIKKLNSRRDRISTECPDCSAIADAGDRPTLGDYIVGGLQAVSPMVMAGIQAGSYNRYLKTNLTAYNGYLGNSLANCQAYISQGTTLGIPSSPCHNAMWTGGIAQAPGGGGYGIYGGIGFNGAVGMMYGGMPGGYGAGYGAYGYGGMPGAIGMAVGGMYGGMPGMYGGQIGGGMYGGMAVGGMYGGMPGMYGGQIGGGMYGGQMGGMYGGMPGAVGMAVGAGIGGLYGGTYGGMYGGQMGGMYGMQMGAQMGSYVSTMGMGGSYGYGVDPSYQLNAARMQMQQQNMQISQQQMMEAQYRYGQVANQGAGMMGYGMSYGGYGGGYGAQGIGGYGYGYGGMPGGGYGGAVIGTAIGSLYGVSY